MAKMSNENTNNNSGTIKKDIPSKQETKKAKSVTGSTAETVQKNKPPQKILPDNKPESRKKGGNEKNIPDKYPLRGNPIPDITKKNSDEKPAKILFAASEALPFIATGGLADVMGSLPSALKNEGMDVRVIMPLYLEISGTYKSHFTFIGSAEISLAWRKQHCSIYSYEYNGVIYYFIENECYFSRQGIYGHYDDGERFAFFCKCVTDILKTINYIPDIIHCNDWHTALVPVYLKTIYREDSILNKIRTVFTIHNIEYQGKFSEEILEDVFSIPDRFYSFVEYEGNINLLKGAIQCCDILMTVSPTYAKEIMTPCHSHGLHYIITDDKQKVQGILNGIDYSVYNPQTDNALFKNYGVNTIEYKAENKKGLQKLLNLTEDESIPIIAVISRLVAHKGMDLIVARLEEILKERVQLIILGKGEMHYENLFIETEKTYKEKMRAVIAYNSDLARKIYAGADIFLMPSKSEPCGLAQMIASRYGTVPIVRETGGLADSIKDIGYEDGNGFTFAQYNDGDMYNRVISAIKLYNQGEKWKQLVEKTMNVDFSWKKSAKKYSELYRQLLK